jgi:hypothetical protein
MSPWGHFRQIDPLPTLSACPLRSDRVAQFVQQPRILDGDDSLAGEVLHQLNMLVGERAHFPPPGQ